MNIYKYILYIVFYISSYLIIEKRYKKNIWIIKKKLKIFGKNVYLLRGGGMRLWRSGTRAGRELGCLT